MMRVGITGSRFGPVSDEQAHTLKQSLKGLMGKENILYHGACVGVDEEAVMMAQELGYSCVAIPPIDKKSVSEAALMLSIEIRPDLGYLARNREIVHECEILIAVPHTNYFAPLSGTW
jgi:hypothetical protein